ncbi:hypothetical protein M6B38_301085 [Iris pallida]|uniref:Uncharacterized protein n=1 Tax=Iris pallida TaxID=29817 RepID=A0AAX6HNK8_IRIPA|nr:hypothetical protein M6B38_301085 [Iris pallida]
MPRGCAELERVTQTPSKRSVLKEPHTRTKENGSGPKVMRFPSLARQSRCC